MSGQRHSTALSRTRSITAMKKANGLNNSQAREPLLQSQADVVGTRNEVEQIVVASDEELRSRSTRQVEIRLVFGIALQSKFARHVINDRCKPLTTSMNSATT